MRFVVSSQNRGCTVATRTSTSSRSARPVFVRRHRSREIMFAAILLTVCIRSSLAFRGPHHPSGSVSHHHYVPVNNVKLTQDEELLHDATHLAEDMGGLAEQIDVSQMDAQTLEFYYFKVHDIDNNTKLDGLELLHALQHPFHDSDSENDVHHANEGNHVPDEHEDLPLDTSWIVELIDRVLEEDDLDKDGYLGYIEYVVGRQKDQDENARKDMKLKI